jgi:hypothetical protein
MNIHRLILVAVGLIALTLFAASSSQADTTIDTYNAFAYGANIGWANAFADGTNGAIVGQFYCSGYIYSPNVGWISLNNGNPPANGYAYSNSGTDWGVNNVGGGSVPGMTYLAGKAYGANVGWITFEQTYGIPAVNLVNGLFTGYAYSANCGWISLINDVAVLQTDTLSPGPIDPINGLPVAWEKQYSVPAGMNPNSDPTGKGYSILQDYLAGTNPNDSDDYLHITAISANDGGSTNLLTWTSNPTRLYYVQTRTNLTFGAWSTNIVTLGTDVVVPDPGSSTARTVTDDPAVSRFFRVGAIIPLSP